MSELSAPAALYLRRLGLPLDLPPTLETLVRIHHRHLETVPYENLGIMLGRPPSVLPAECLDRVGAVGRAGYCFHQNGALELVLRDLGFDVSRRHGHVWTEPGGRADPALNHLVLVVSGLATNPNPGGRWWMDVGLGDCFRDPLPVRVGEWDQDGFRYAITEVRDDGWSFLHDALGSFTGIEVSAARPVDQPAVDAAHEGLSTWPGGQFAHLLVVQRRHPDGADTLRGCVWTHVERGELSRTEVTTYDTWRAALSDGLRLPLDGVPDVELQALFDRSLHSFREWDAAGRP